MDGFAKAEQLFLPQLKKARIREEEERRQKEQAKLRENEAMLKLALKMKKYGEFVADIIKETGLSSEEIAYL